MALTTAAFSENRSQSLVNAEAFETIARNRRASLAATTMLFVRLLIMLQIIH